MKIFNYCLIFVGGLFVAFIFHNFVAILPMYLSQINRPFTPADVQNYYLIRNVIDFFGFIIGWFAFKFVLA